MNEYPSNSTLAERRNMRLKQVTPAGAQNKAVTIITADVSTVEPEPAEAADPLAPPSRPPAPGRARHN
jgi:hypothetical protein